MITLDEYFKSLRSYDPVDVMCEFKKEFDGLKDRIEKLEKYKEIVKVGMNKLHNIKGLT